MDLFFEPVREILIATNADDVVHYLRNIPSEHARRIGSAMHNRGLRDHTYELRAKEVDVILQGAGRPAEIPVPLVNSAA